MSDASQTTSPTPPADEDAFERVCSGILQCQRSIGLYPREHPRVSSSLEDLRRSLREYHLSDAATFSFRVSDLLESDDDASRTASRRELARVLEHRLIEEVVLPPNVSSDELHRFLSLLREDLLLRPERRDHVMIELQSLDTIRLSFYELRELPPIVPPGDSEPGDARATGDPLASLDESTREALLRELERPELRERIRRLGARIDSHAEGVRRATAQHLPLVREILRAAIEDTGRGDRPLDPAAIVDGFGNVLEFFEQNAAALNASPDLMRGGLDGRFRSDDLSVALNAGESVSTHVRDMQIEKQRLAAIFRTAGDAPPSTTPADGPGSSRRREEGTGVASPDGTKQLERAIAEIEYDPESIARNAWSTSPRATWTRVVLELSIEKDGDLHARRRLKGAAKRLLRTGVLANEAREILESLVPYLDLPGCAAARDLASMTLAAVDSIADLRELFVDVLLPNANEKTASGLLDGLVDRNRKGAVQLLCGLCRATEPGLRAIATEKLIELSPNPAFLCAWAREDSATLLVPETFARVANAVGLHRFGDALADYFRQAPSKATANFVLSLQPQVTGTEEAILAAVEHGGALARRTALGALHRFTSTAVVPALAEIIRKNNFRTSPDMAEVRGALDSLCRLDSAEAKAFLEEVESSKDWLRHTYRKEIRRALAGLRGKAAK